VHADSRQDFRKKQFIANTQRRIDLPDTSIGYTIVADNFLQTSCAINASRIPPIYQIQVGRKDWP